MKISVKNDLAVYKLTNMADGIGRRHMMCVLSAIHLVLFVSALSFNPSKNFKEDVVIEELPQSHDL